MPIKQYITGSRIRGAATWVLQLAVGGLFIAAGASKVLGVPDMVALFDQIGAGQGFRLLTGIIEVVAGLALFLPILVPPGAAVLGGVLIGALIAHVFILQTSFMHIPVIAALLIVLVWLRRDQVRSWLDRFSVLAR